MLPPLRIVSVRPLMATMPRDHGFPIQTIVVDDVEEDCIDDCIDVDIASAVAVVNVLYRNSYGVIECIVVLLVAIVRSIEEATGCANFINWLDACCC